MERTVQHEEEKGVDLRFRLGVRKQEIPLILPISEREAEEIISSDATFPRGFSLRAGGYKKYDVAELRAWWEMKKEQCRAEQAPKRKIA